jgi:putative restriction endonuclease
VGYLTVTPEYKLEVSPRLREEWQNGREYYAHHGKMLGHMPIDAANRPDAKFLRWHNEEVFKT